MKPTVYIETTIPSYLAARPSRDLVVAAHQQITEDWWSRRRTAFRLFTSQLVLEEAGRGDSDAARRRLGLLKPIKVLAVGEEVLHLSEAIVSAKLIPSDRAADAVHVAVAAVNGLDFLLTWNCAHINNAEIADLLAEACEGHGFRCPVMCTPEQLMGG
ncbi:MAG: type II toxin-antitoxin system VapC family toxin [Phycisphaerae bacterium]|nr:type II toxin-antitoxin system VapC family toxin [Phycisphaerae bacterium]